MDLTSSVAESRSPRDARLSGNEPWIQLGSIRALHYRPAGSSQPIGADQLALVESEGIENDIHAHRQSPRQILIAGTDVYEDFSLPASTLRENVLVDFPTSTLKSSGLLRIGCEAVLWLTFQCEACGHLAKIAKNSPRLTKEIGNRRGILARVLKGGCIRIDDPVSHRQLDKEKISDQWQERVLAVLFAVPEDKQIEYRQLARMAGVPRSYCRVFPKLLAQAPSGLEARARAGHIGNADHAWSGEDFFSLKALCL